ncbi:RecE family exodeoxyribonuclease [Leclercia sp.]|uniref:RecE family exodeoxyribonuclease n=1 Tax=Leclercia sp. TaxID=1898428 RepID=UPI0028A60E4E|nr:RecE family exodeoxyribonuclease [Leclercia sp.]
MEFFYLVKATQKSGKPDAVVWLSANTQSRAALQLDVALEDAGIETGRGKDYAKPVRTDMPVVDDLPEEGVVCFEFCKRYALADDQRTWNVIPGATSQGEASLAPVTTSDEEQTAVPVTSTDTADAGKTSLLENRTPAVRFAVHLLGDKYLSEISQEQQIVANELATDEGNAYFQNLLQAKNDVADIGELSLHAEWKLVQAVKDVFPQDKEHEPAQLAAFMSGWIKAEDRNQLVEDWKSGKLPAKDEPTHWYENGLRVNKNDDGLTRYPVCKMPFRKQLLAQLTVDELRHHTTRSENAELHALEMDTDNGYIQDLLLAAENFAEVKAFDTKDLWRYTNAIRKVFSMDKRHELGLLLQFTKAWVATPYIDRGILTREWAAGNRINLVQRTDAGTNADGGYVTDRGEGAHHTLDTLDLEIACALLPMDFHHFEIPSSVLRRAKEIVSTKEEPWKSWSKILRNQPGVLAVNRAAIFNLVRIAPENVHLTQVAHLEFVNRTMTAEFNAATELLTLPAPAAEPEVPAAQPGGGGKTDRNPNYKPDFDGLDTEIALATLSADFNIYDIPSDAFRQAKAIVAANESPFKEWFEALRATPGILDYSRAAIFALIRSAHPEHYKQPGPLDGYINANLTETDHENPTEEVLTAARHTPEVSWEKEINEKIEAEKAALASQPQVANLGGGMFSIEGLMNENQPHTDDRSPVAEETTSDVQMETTDPAEGEAGNPVQPGESADAADPQTDALSPAVILAAAAPELANATQPEVTTEAPEEIWSAPEYPAYFEPGRYEGLPNNVYHAANGISSTQVKDARVSLMFYHGRHVTKTIRRESSEALTFGSLAHTLALEPEKLDEEFAVFPGVPEGAFTTTDSMKAFIREFNANKPKAEQLKLTGKKEELQAAIRAVNPDAIFADEFEQEWRDSVAGKTILSNEQLTLATAIQQALFNHESAGKLLRHPSRSVETSYFGMDEETGLEVRVRPDLEVEINGVRIGVDLKTISMGRVKQDGLRDKLHREIIDRDYHLSAGMYCSVADFDQFFWIFVNKDEGYHWVAVIEASEDLLALGMQEYQKTMRALSQAYDTNYWPAPITEDYTDELNDFDLRRLEALRLA